MTDFLDRPLKLFNGDPSILDGAQLRLGYDEDNYLDFAVDAEGDVVITGTGGTLSLPSIVLAAEAFIGDGDGLTNLAADALASGTVPLARITGLTNDQIAADAAIDVTKLAAGSAGQVLRVNESDEPEWGAVDPLSIVPGSEGQILQTNESGEVVFDSVEHSRLTDRDAAESHPVEAISYLSNGLDKWIDFFQPENAPVEFLEAIGVTVSAHYDMARKAIVSGGFVQGWNDSRAETDDGQVYVSGVSGEGLVGASGLTDMDALAGLTIVLELCRQNGSSGGQAYVTRASSSSPTGTQLALIDNGGTSVVAFIGNGAAISRVDGLLGVAGGVRARLAMRFDGAAGTDATRVTFRRSTYDAVTESWTAGAALTSSVVTPGVPAALISLAATTTPIAIGRYSYSTGGAFNGIIGGNGESVRVWSAALTDGEIDAELASDYVVRSSDLLLGYDFSGATPYANSGSAGAAGDLTPSANLVLASGDRRYSFVASPATNNPSYDDTGVYPVAVFNGTDNYFRNVDFGKLPQITADTMIAWIGTVPGLPVASYGMVSLSRAENLGLVMIRRNNAFVESTVDLASYAAVDAPEAGTMVALFSRRVSGGSGTAIAVRDGLGTEATATGSPVSGSNALNRLTICASRANVVSLFTPASVAQIIVMRGLTADNIDAAQRFIARMAAAHCGAVIR